MANIFAGGGYRAIMMPRQAIIRTKFSLNMKRNMRKKLIVALVYDFDGTLSPGNMQEFEIGRAHV